MKRIKLFEEHTKDYHVSNLFDIIISNIKKDNNILNNQPNLTLLEIEKSNVNDAIEKNIILNFEDTDYNYQIILVLKPHNSPDFKKKEYKGYMMIKLYDIETTEIVVGNEYQITLSDTEDGIQVKEETEAQIQAQGQAQGQAPQGQMAQGQGQAIQGQMPAQGQGMQEMPAESLKYKGYYKLNEEESQPQTQTQPQNEKNEDMVGDYDGSIERFIIEKIAELQDKI